MPPATSSQQGLLLRRLGDAIKARRTGRARSGGWRGCLHDFPLPSLRRCSQIAVRFILANLQRAEHAVEVSRFGRVAIGAAEARMNHPDMASAPLRAAFFDRPIEPGQAEGERRRVRSPNPTPFLPPRVE